MKPAPVDPVEYDRRRVRTFFRILMAVTVAAVAAAAWLIWMAVDALRSAS